jgi:plastocyanin
MRTRILVNSGIAMALALGFAACGGDSGPVSPGGGGGGGNDGTIAATVVITGSGVSPRDVTISAGQRVQFVNNDTQAHTINSDPHPEHTSCPPINDVGFTAVGATRATSNMNTVRTCGYHDHNLPDDSRFHGTIRVQ